MLSYTKTNIAKIIRSSVSLSLFSYLIMNLIVFPLPIAFAEETQAPDKNALTQQIQTEAQQGVQNSLQEHTVETNTSASENNQPTNQTPQEQSTQTLNTGANATENSQTGSTTQSAVDNNNSAAVNQEINAKANTGNNEASRNISFGGNAGIIVTGNAGVLTNAKTDTNSNTTSIGYSSGSGNTSDGTTNTGNGLTKSTSSQNTKLTMVNNNNQTVINQGSQTEATTGNNKADGNISIGGSAGVIFTGSAYTSTNFLTTTNGNVVLIGGETNGNGPGSGASIVLLNTGDNNDFALRVMRQRSTTVRNTNSALISQSCGAGQALCMANTGYNTSNRNIGLAGSAGVIQTGDALVYVDMKADTNSNETTISTGTTGAGSNTNIANTGNNTTTTASTSDSNYAHVENANTSTINQKVHAYANTGHNQANRNISFGGDAGVIFTGDAAVIVNLEAQANENSATLKQETSNPIASETESDPIYRPCPNSHQSTEIVNTGSNFDTDTSAESTTQTNVINTNKAVLSQQIAGKVNTGYNSTDKNIGNQTGIIFTGDAVLAAQITADANKNETTVGCNVLAKTNPTPTEKPPVTPTPTSSPNPTATPTTTPSGNGVSNGGNGHKGGGGTTTLASTSSKGLNGGVPISSGQVLGASVSRLPITGPENLMSTLLASLAVLISGGVLSRTPFASRTYKLTFKERG